MILTVKAKAPPKRRKRKKLESVAPGRVRAYVSVGAKTQRVVEIKDGIVSGIKIQYLE